LSKLLKETGVFYVFPSETNFLLVKILKKGIAAGQLKEKLAEKGILIRNCGDFPGLDQGYFRMTVRSAEENLTLIDALKGILSAYLNRKIALQIQVQFKLVRFNCFE
jgi:threonine-phosphate decarboxylase